MPLRGGSLIEKSGLSAPIASTTLPVIGAAFETTAPMSLSVDVYGRVTSVDEVWSASRTYRNLDLAVGSDSALYISQQASNLNNDPTTDTTATYWRVVQGGWATDLHTEKLPCRAATTANITLSGTQTVDGVALVVGNRCLVKNQTTAADRGIYVVAAGAWTRSLDADSSAEVITGMNTRVTEGTTNVGTWYLSTTGTITLGSTSLTFTQSTSGGGVLPVGTDTQTLYNVAGTWTASSFVRNSGTQWSVGAGTPTAGVEATIFGTGTTGASPTQLFEIHEVTAAANSVALGITNDTSGKALTIGVVGTAANYGTGTVQGDVAFACSSGNRFFWMTAAPAAIMVADATGLVIGATGAAGARLDVTAGSGLAALFTSVSGQTGVKIAGASNTTAYALECTNDQNTVARFTSTAVNSCVVDIGANSSAPTNTNTFGQLRFGAFVSSVWNVGVTFQTIATETWANGTANGCHLDIYTKATTSATATARIRIGSNGDVSLNKSGSALATNATLGFTHIPNCAGTPTGVPALTSTGATPMVYDTTNSKIWFYSGSWKGVVVA